jgi:hypothetical protein
MRRPALSLPVVILVGLAGCSASSPPPPTPAPAAAVVHPTGRIVAEVEIIGTDGQLVSGCWLSAVPDGSPGASSTLRDVGFNTLVGLSSSLVVDKPGQGSYHIRLIGLAPDAPVDDHGHLTAPARPLAYGASGIVPLDGQAHAIALSPENDAPATLIPAARITAWPP